jgi:pimeloyl-ACP methyl ester carboxylesterase
MIMGLGANVDWWDPRIILELSKKFRVVMFDNRGAGRTDVSIRSYTINLFIDDTAGFMNALGISKAHVLGISMGGMIVQELALNYSENVEKLILCSTNCGGSKSIPLSEEVLRLLVADRSLLSPEEIARMAIPPSFYQGFYQKEPRFYGAFNPTNHEGSNLKRSLYASAKCNNGIRHT